MEIKDIFKSDITRDINGIIKVEDREIREVSQELSEYVLTDKLENEYDQFFENYYDSYGTTTQDVGVWVSGFFGSGKSQLVKNLGYILEDKELGEKFSSERFIEKVEESFLRADIKNTVRDIDTNVLMFDIKSQEDQLHKGDSAEGKPITEIIFRKFNEEQGYGRIPWIALLERELEDKGKYEEFKEAIEDIGDQEWSEQRNNTLGVQGNIKKALVEIGIDDDRRDAEDTIDSQKNDKTLTPSNLSEILLEDLENSENDRFVLIMDEIGQYVGDNDDKLLELQSIVENFGEKGNGNLWVIVTAQSQLSKIIDGVKKKEDIFKKISDRFETKINLDSANIDKVVRERILEKTVAAQKELEQIYSDQSGSLKKNLRLESNQHIDELDEESFSTTYPFLPYQLDLIPKILSNLRSSGGIDTTAQQITGRERNMIKIIQNSIKQNVLDEEIGSIITLDIIFDQIKTDLPEEVVRRIEMLELEGDTEKGKKILKTLYLLQQLEWVPNTTENITKSLTPDLDQNKREIQKEVEEVLDELQSGKYIEKQPNGYRYLTPTERDIVDELQRIKIRNGEIRRETKKHVKQVMDLAQISHKGAVFKFKLDADGENLRTGGKTSEITLEVITPVEQAFSDKKLTDYEEKSITEENKIYWIAENKEELVEQVKEFKSLEKLLSEKNRDKEISKAAREAIRRKKEQKTEKQQEIVDTLKEAFLNGNFLYQGERGEVIGQKPEKAFQNYVEGIIEDIYPKYDIGQAKVSNSDIKAVLTDKELPDACSQLELLDQRGDITENATALKELTEFIDRRSREHLTGKKILNHFQKTPYGWDSNVVQLLAAVALRASLIQVRYQEQEYLDYTDEELLKILPNSRKFKKCEIENLNDIDQENLYEAKEAIDEIWDERISQALSEIVSTLDQKREKTYSDLEETRKAAQHIDLPIQSDLDSIRETLDNSIDDRQSTELIKALIENKEEISEAKEDLDQYHAFTEDDEKVESFKNMLKFVESVLPEIEEEIGEKNELKQLVGSKDIVEHWKTAKQDFTGATETFSEKYRKLHDSVSEEYEEKVDRLKENNSFQELDDGQQDAILSDLEEYKCDGQIENPEKKFRCPECRRDLKELQTNLRLSSQNYQDAVQKVIDTVREQESEEDEQEEPDEVESINLVGRARRIDNQDQLDEFIQEIREELKQKLKNGKSVELR
jgi:hypothetical protein